MNHPSYQTVDKRGLAYKILLAAHKANVLDASAWIVGSYARGYATPNSDVDVWVCVKKNTKYVRENLPLDLHYMNEFGKPYVDFVVFDYPPPTEYRRIDLLIDGYYAQGNYNKKTWAF